jgi:hypothetical protein
MYAIAYKAINFLMKKISLVLLPKLIKFMGSKIFK